ncbi:Hypothetical predicted protein, partial [Pelobates cultripes]
DLTTSVSVCRYLGFMTSASAESRLVPGFPGPVPLDLGDRKTFACMATMMELGLMGLDVRTLVVYRR